MSESSTVEVVKINEGLSEHPKTYQITHNDQLKVGGQEGRKILTSLTDEQGNQKGNFVSKEYGIDQKERVIEIINTYNVLRKKDYPVPSVTRYYEQNNKIYLLMSDVTENGRYSIWGWS